MVIGGMLAALGLAALGDIDALFADPPEAPVCSVTLTVDVTDAGETERQVFAYDGPSRRWRALSVAGDQPTAQDREDMRDDAEGRPPPASYYAAALERGHLTWAPVPDRPGLYRATDLPDGEIEMSGRDLSDRMMIEYEVGETPAGPVLLSGTAKMIEPWRIPFVARIDGLEIRRDYAPAPPRTGAPGAMLPTYERLAFKGDVMGEASDSLVETAYSDWDCTPAPGRD